MGKRILFVDDEPNILKSLLRLFIDTSYDILTAESGEEALGLLERKAVDIVISDIRMPQMDGYQLLSKVKELYPTIFRVILSGYADEKLIFKALQHNIAKFYIFKPWNNKNLIKMVDQIFETDELLERKDIKLIVNNLSDLPTLDTRFQRINSLIERDASMFEIAQEIERDQSLASKILHIVNSAYYGVKTGSIRQGVTYLGMQNVKNLILSTSILETLKGNGAAEKVIEKYWNHAFLTNRILNFIYERCLGKKLPDIMQTAGLLHNVGIVFFLNSYGERYYRLINEAEKKKSNLLEIEKKEFGLTHQEIGGYLLNWWDLPFAIVEAALYHHEPNGKTVNSELVYSVNIAEKYAWDMFSTRAHLWGYDDNVISCLGFEKSKFEEQLRVFKNL